MSSGKWRTFCLGLNVLGSTSFQSALFPRAELFLNSSGGHQDLHWTVIITISTSLSPLHSRLTSNRISDRVQRSEFTQFTSGDNTTRRACLVWLASLRGWLACKRRGLALWYLWDFTDLPPRQDSFKLGTNMAQAVTSRSLDFYAGSRLLQPVSDLTGLQIDQVSHRCQAGADGRWLRPAHLGAVALTLKVCFKKTLMYKIVPLVLWSSKDLSVGFTVGSMLKLGSEFCCWWTSDTDDNLATCDSSLINLPWLFSFMCCWNMWIFVVHCMVFHTDVILYTRYIFVERQTTTLNFNRSVVLHS